jgi:fructose-1,6-bisphosphatase/sedoheptulose 1,7-bisphosphatase-like protein
MSDDYSPPVKMILAKFDEFTEDELHHLNRLIIERLRLMQQVKAHRAMTQLRVGQRVQFTTPDGRVVAGLMTRYNRKSVSVIAGTGESWTVAPTFLREA